MEASNEDVKRGTFNYLASSVASSLYRNGAVGSQRDLDGSDAELRGLVLDEREMAICDARGLAGDARPTCERNGFELLRRSLAPRPRYSRRARPACS